MEVFAHQKILLLLHHICQVLREPGEVFPLRNFAPWDTLFHCFVDLLCTEEEVLMMLESILRFLNQTVLMAYLATRMLEATAHTIAPAITTPLTGQLRMVDYPMTGKYPSLYLFLRKVTFQTQK